MVLRDAPLSAPRVEDLFGDPLARARGLRHRPRLPPRQFQPPCPTSRGEAKWRAPSRSSTPWKSLRRSELKEPQDARSREADQNVM